VQRIIYLKDYKGHKKGEIEIVSNNVAHGLIELGVAKIATKRKSLRKPPMDRMMRPQKEAKKLKKGKYITK